VFALHSDLFGACAFGISVVAGSRSEFGEIFVLDAAASVVQAGAVAGC
jgi:hypothetical protein